MIPATHSHTNTNHAINTPKRGRGRPKKIPTQEIIVIPTIKLKNQSLSSTPDVKITSFAASKSETPSSTSHLFSATSPNSKNTSSSTTSASTFPPNTSTSTSILFPAVSPIFTSTSTTSSFISTDSSLKRRREEQKESVEETQPAKVSKNPPPLVENGAVIATQKADKFDYIPGLLSALKKNNKQENFLFVFKKYELNDLIYSSVEDLKFLNFIELSSPSNDSEKPYYSLEDKNLKIYVTPGENASKWEIIGTTSKTKSVGDFLDKTGKTQKGEWRLVNNVQQMVDGEETKPNGQVAKVKSTFDFTTDKITEFVAEYNSGEIEKVRKIFYPNEKVKEQTTHYKNKIQVTHHYNLDGTLLPNITKNFMYKEAYQETYHGSFDSGKMSGLGKYTFWNGDIYIGRFENDSALGYMRDGDVYSLNLNEKPIKNARYIFQDGGKISKNLDRIAEKALIELFRIMKKP